MLIVFETDHWRRFTRAECCASLYRNRGSYWVAEAFEEVVGRGVRGPRHMSIGRFRPKDIAAIAGETPCYLPWTVVEPEEGDLLERWEHARRFIEALGAEGFYDDALEVRFSGNRSFWVCIPAGLMGHPLGSVYDQRALRERVFLPLVECRVDRHLWDGRHLLRVVGSEHETGGRVRRWPAWVFMEARLDELFRTRWDGQAGEARPLPTLVERCRQKTRFHVPLMEDVAREAHGGGFMEETEEGVSEGNRNYDAFRRACVLVRRHAVDAAWAELQGWNQKNDPPLPERELRQCFRSAIRTVTHHDRAA